MSECLFVIGDTRDVTAKLPDGSVDLVLTSPPFLALRSYLPADHPDKGREIGSEATPADFLQVLLELTAEWGRVLAPHGSICVELGDTYSGSGGAGGDYNAEGLREGQQAFSGSAAKRRKAGIGDDYRPARTGRRQPPNTSHRTHPDGSIKTSAAARAMESKNNAVELPPNGGPGWPLDKSLCGIPHLYHLSLAYGRNLLTGEPSPAGQWRVRNVVAWCRPNPPVGALGDKFRPATSYLTIATKARDRWFDLDAVRTEPSANTHARIAKGAEPRTDLPSQQRDGNWNTLPATNDANPAGAPPLDWWAIPTAPYAGSHYAVFPPALLERPIKAMCPIRVCTVCGQPARRIVDAHRISEACNEGRTKNHAASNPRSGFTADVPENGWEYERTTLGWTDCGHESWRTGRVLDPFGGSGTTGLVATGHGRDALLIDLDARNYDLAVDRVGPLLLRAASVGEAAVWLGAKAEAA